MKAEGVVDIRDFTWQDQYWYVQVSETLAMDGQSVDVHIAPVTYAPTVHTVDGDDPSGSKTMFGVFASQGHHRRLIQLLAGPAQYSVAAYTHGPRELRQEKRALELIGRQPLAALVVGAPRAFQTNEVVYESTAPGIQLASAVEMVAKAHEFGEISDQEAALMLTKFHISARQALQALHSQGIKHNHAHVRNFNIDIYTGSAAIFDYTLAVSKHAPDTVFMTDEELVTADNMHEDDHKLAEAWGECLRRAGLDPSILLERFEPRTMDAAIAKLQAVVIRAAVRAVGIESISDEDVQRVQAATERLIGAAPDVYYPKNTYDQRWKRRLARLGGFIRP